MMINYVGYIYIYIYIYVYIYIYIDIQYSHDVTTSHHHSNCKIYSTSHRHLPTYLPTYLPTWVNIAVVSIRDSIPRAGFSLSKQNSSISSNKMIVRSSMVSLLKMQDIRDAMFSSPSARKHAVSMVRKLHPKQLAIDVQIVVFAVPKYVRNDIT